MAIFIFFANVSLLSARIPNIADKIIYPGFPQLPCGKEF
jgi:hypothetical protein